MLVSASFICLLKGDTKGRGITGPVNRNEIYNCIKLTQRLLLLLLSSGKVGRGQYWLCVYRLRNKCENVAFLFFVGVGVWFVCVCGGGGVISTGFGMISMKSYVPSAMQLD